MKLFLVYNGMGSHRIVLEGTPGGVRCHGDWASYQGIATLKLSTSGREFIATTGYHDLCGSRIVELKAVDDIEQAEEREAE